MKRTLIPMLFLLAACDSTTPPQPETPRASSPVFDTQIQAIDKARGVEGQLESAADAQRRQLEAESQ